MGLASSRMGPASSHLVSPRPRRRSSIRRTLSSVFICGASTRMEDYPAELLVDSAEHSGRGKLKLTRKGSDVVCTKSETGVSSRRCLEGNEAPQMQASNVHTGNKEEGLFECGEVIRNNESASSSIADQTSSSHASAIEIVSPDSVNGLSCSTCGGSSQPVEAQSSSNSLHSNGAAESLSGESNVSEAIHFSNSECSSIISDSPMQFYFLRDDSVQEVVTSSSGFQELERTQNMPNGSSNVSSSNYDEINSHESRRNGRRLFWDAFSRHYYRRMTDSRSSVFSSDDSDHSRPDDRWHDDYSNEFFSDEREGDIRSRQSRIQGSNEQQWNTRSEIWGSNLDSIDNQTGVCPRGIHSDGSCSCQSDSTAEESAAQAGISRVVLLAEALLEVLDIIYQQPMMHSLSMLSIPAPESVVDSFPVKIYSKAENSECANDVSQCYICLDEYEEDDKIRVLPCNHEYHMSCVDKWLKEVHGVCPLCRGDVCDGLTSTSDSDQESDIVSP